MQDHREVAFRPRHRLTLNMIGVQSVSSRSYFAGSAICCGGPRMQGFAVGGTVYGAFLLQLVGGPVQKAVRAVRRAMKFASAVAIDGYY